MLVSIEVTFRHCYEEPVSSRQRNGEIIPSRSKISEGHGVAAFLTGQLGGGRPRGLRERRGATGNLLQGQITFTCVK